MKREWLQAPELVRLLAVLGAPDVDVRVVGGCVRNAVMDRAVSEIDVATPETPDAVMKRLSAAGVRAIPTGLEHGTVTALVDGKTFEVTSLRRDTACDGRHAAVEFTTDWAEDARRRDFTFNAMSMRRDGHLFDYFGGAEDAAKGRVRFVGEAADRIREDYLRILRLFRFFAWYGRVTLDADTLAACRAHADGLARLSAERIQQEIVKTLAAPAPEQAFMLMEGCGVLAVVLPEVRDLARLAALTRLESAVAAAIDWRRRLAALLAGGESDSVAARLKFSAVDRERLRRLTATEPLVDATTPPTQVRAAIYKSGAEIISDRVLLAWAHARTRGAGDAGWAEQLAVADAWEPRTLPVSGADVLALGLGQGPHVGRILSAVEAWWIAHDFAPPRDEALVELRRQAEL